MGTEHTTRILENNGYHWGLVNKIQQVPSYLRVSAGPSPACRSLKLITQKVVGATKWHCVTKVTNHYPSAKDILDSYLGLLSRETGQNMVEPCSYHVLSCFMDISSDFSHPRRILEARFCFGRNAADLEGSLPIISRLQNSKLHTCW